MTAESMHGITKEKLVEEGLSVGQVVLELYAENRHSFLVHARTPITFYNIAEEANYKLASSAYRLK